MLTDRLNNKSVDVYGKFAWCVDKNPFYGRQN